MKADMDFLDDIEQAIEEGKLELSSWDELPLLDKTREDSIKDRLSFGFELSKKQREALDRIHNKIDVW